MLVFKTQMIYRCRSVMIMFLNIYTTEVFDWDQIPKH